MWGGQVRARKRLTTERAQSGEEAASFAPLQLVAKGDVLPVASAAAVAAAVVAAEAPGELQLSTVRSSLDTAVVERMESRTSGAEESFEAAPDSSGAVQMACDDRNYEIDEESVSLHRAAPLPSLYAMLCGCAVPSKGACWSYFIWCSPRLHRFRSLPAVGAKHQGMLVRRARCRSQAPLSLPTRRPHLRRRYPWSPVQAPAVQEAPLWANEPAPRAMRSRTVPPRCSRASCSTLLVRRSPLAPTLHLLWSSTPPRAWTRSRAISGHRRGVPLCSPRLGSIRSPAPCRRQYRS